MPLRVPLQVYDVLLSCVETYEWVPGQCGKTAGDYPGALDMSKFYCASLSANPLSYLRIHKKVIAVLAVLCEGATRHHRKFEVVDVA
eukprot:694747-Amphidinium_carterae.1